MLKHLMFANEIPKDFRKLLWTAKCYILGFPLVNLFLHSGKFPKGQHTTLPWELATPGRKLKMSRILNSPKTQHYGYGFYYK